MSARLSVKSNLDGVRFPLVDAIENKLAVQIIVFGAQHKSFGGLAVQQDRGRARTSAAPFSVAVRTARNAMIVACVVPHAPLEFFLRLDR
jgi:hypothetical protein